MLVAIASYGRGQDHYLAQLLAEFRRFSLPVTVVVMTNAPKPVEGAELLVGLPSPNPYSLPFAHRKLFGERVNDFDLFLYTEDDTLVTEQNIRAFLELQPELRDNEILGFLRSEIAPDGRKFVSSIHSHFRWLPDTVVDRGGELFAQISNQHSGSFLVTRAQLQRAIASGGFLVPPHAGKYGMLECAATDIYIRCGFTRLLCLSRIEECLLPHLANKYYGRLGVPIEELRDYTEGLIELHRAGSWKESLFEPQTAEFEFRWSKHLYSGPDLDLLEQVPASAKRVLVVGAASGRNEFWLADRGFEVTAIPLDAVFAYRLRKRGIRTLEGGWEAAMAKVSKESFDAIILPEVLHLVPEPVDWLKRLRGLLVPGGHIIISLENTGDPLTRFQDWRESAGSIDVHKANRPLNRVSTRRIRKWLKGAGFASSRVLVSDLGTDKRHLLRKIGFKILKFIFGTKFISVGRA